MSSTDASQKRDSLKAPRRIDYGYALFNGLFVGRPDVVHEPLFSLFWKR